MNNVFNILWFMVRIRLKRKTNCVIYGEGSMNNRTCQKWFAKFYNGYLSLNDAPRPDRQVEVYCDQIKNNQLYDGKDRKHIQNIKKGAVKSRYFITTWDCGASEINDHENLRLDFFLKSVMVENPLSAPLRKQNDWFEQMLLQFL